MSDKKEKKSKKSGDKKSKKSSSKKPDLSGVVNAEPIANFYEIGRTIGTSDNSTVKEGTNKATGSKVAIKCFKKSGMGRTELASLRVEAVNLRKLDHPNIMKMIDLFEDADTFYMVTELVRGKELFDKIVERGQYTEQDAQNIAKQVLSAVNYLHSKGIAHRDLKPEALISVGSGEEEMVKLADFGLSKNFGEGDMATMVGTPDYVAPEVLEADEYDSQVDLWSIGVIVYIILVGYPPFAAESAPAQLQKILTCNYEFGDGWEFVSDAAKDFVRGLLVKDPKKRMTAAQAMEHPWVKTAASGTQQLGRKNLASYLEKRGQ